ncbi:hypothetical protein GQ54DRAFT_220850 [Martensiomyces pterosporus]|nr:hypothetical protein GQ54DRAFT_220850 [Martensiomyces pterosporus]
MGHSISLATQHGEPLSVEYFPCAQNWQPGALAGSTTLASEAAAIVATADASSAVSSSMGGAMPYPIHAHGVSSGTAEIASSTRPLSYPAATVYFESHTLPASAADIAAALASPTSTAAAAVISVGIDSSADASPHSMHSVLVNSVSISPMALIPATTFQNVSTIPSIMSPMPAPAHPLLMPQRPHTDIGVYSSEAVANLSNQHRVFHGTSSTTEFALQGSGRGSTSSNEFGASSNENSHLGLATQTTSGVRSENAMFPSHLYRYDAAAYFIHALQCLALFYLLTVHWLAFWLVYAFRRMLFHCFALACLCIIIGCLSLRDASFFFAGAVCHDYACFAPLRKWLSQLAAVTNTPNCLHIAKATLP